MFCFLYVHKKSNGLVKGITVSKGILHNLFLYIFVLFCFRFPQMKREIFELWILSQVFILTRLALFEIEFSVVLAKFQTNSLEWKRENSKLQPPESTQAGQNSASYWIPWLSLSHGVSLQLIAPWMGKSAAHSHVLPGPPGREYAVLLLRQSCGNATLMSPCTRSAGPAVAARSSSFS